MCVLGSELLATAHRLDAGLFAQDCCGLDPDPWQQDLLRSAALRALVLCARQVGKSTTAALMALHASVYVPGHLSLILSPSQRQSLEVLRVVRTLYGSLGDAPAPVAEGATHLELENGSRVLGLPGGESTVRGFASVDLLIIDEAARVPDDLYRAVRPMLAVSGGRLIVLSTPFGRRGFFFESWTGEEDWQRVSVRADECPRITPEFLAEERKAIGDRWFQQEYQCEFVDIVGAIFSAEQIAGLFSSEVKSLHAGTLPAGW
jgi:hypothetical protein